MSARIDEVSSVCASQNSNYFCKMEYRTIMLLPVSYNLFDQSVGIWSRQLHPRFPMLICICLCYSGDLLNFKLSNVSHLCTQTWLHLSGLTGIVPQKSGLEKGLGTVIKLKISIGHLNCPIGLCVTRNRRQHKKIASGFDRFGEKTQYLIYLNFELIVFLKYL